MALEDGRMMLSAERYDALLQSYSAEELYRRRCVPKEMTCMVLHRDLWCLVKTAVLPRVISLVPRSGWFA